MNKLTSNETIVRNDNKVFQQLMTMAAPDDKYNVEWHNGTGYMDHAGPDIMNEELKTFTDQHGRKGIYYNGRLVIERYSDADNSILIGHDFTFSRDGNAYYALPVLESIIKDLGL